MAGAARRVREGAWLGLHNTNSSAEFVALRANGAELSSRDSPLRERAARERMLYRARAVSEQLLLDPQARIRTQCVRASARNARTNETEYDLVSRDSLWMPSRLQWAAFGVEADGYFPASAREAQRIAERSLPRSARAALHIAYDHAPLPAPAHDMLASVAWCAD